jgi:catechol 2,3-dioxygenase
MGVSSDDLYGEAREPQPATPGSYGVAPAGYRLPEATRPGAVRLQVGDLQRSLAYYQQVLGLQVVRSEGLHAQLAARDRTRVLIALHERPGARRADVQPHLGLYHFAILLPERAALGRFVRHLSDLGVRAGAADHLVSEAFYLTDPDGLGIEVYVDRPHSAWRRVGRELMMATDPVDVRDLVREAGDTAWDGMPSGTAMGHVHLHVGDLERAAAFYAEALGFDRTVWRYPGALFLGAGGYHHHLGTNTWAGARAAAPAPDDAQLLAWTLELPDAADVRALRASVEASGYAMDDGADEWFEVRDPWGTRLQVRVAGEPRGLRLS